MNISNCKKKRSNDGVALIISLGLLSVLTLLTVAFAISMRVERLASRSFADSIRAKNLMEVAFTRAMDAVQVGMTAPHCQYYPDWPSSALGSSAGGGSLLLPSIFSGEATNLVPGVLATGCQAVASSVKWQDITDCDDKKVGRVAYLIADCSGLADMNWIGGKYRFWSTNVNEVDITGLFGSSNNAATFLSNRTNFDIRYETVAEFKAMNSAYKRAASNLVAFSYDRNQDVYPDRDDPNYLTKMGTKDVPLKPKFHINDITNYPCYYDGGSFSYSEALSANQPSYDGTKKFKTDYWDKLWALLQKTMPNSGGTGGTRYDDIMYNIVNYLDPDRVPQGVKPFPWRHTEGNEPIPLMNEIVFKKVAGWPDDNHYAFYVELWYPYSPVVVKPGDGFYLHVGVFGKGFTGAPAEWNADGVNHVLGHTIVGSSRERIGGSLTNLNWTYASNAWSFVVAISNMAYASSNEFVVISSPTNRYVYFPYQDSSNVTQFAPIGGTNFVYFLARMMKAQSNTEAYYPGVPVDECFGYGAAEQGQGVDDGTIDGTRRYKLKLFNSEKGYSCADPRSNGQIKYYISGSPTYGKNYPAGDAYETLGTTNRNTAEKFLCANRPVRFQGVPIWAKNGPMETIAELGHIFFSNMDDEDATYPFWRNINLMRKSDGARLADYLTTHGAPREAYGAISPNSPHPEVLKLLFHNLEIGRDATNEFYTATTNLTPTQVNNIVAAFQQRRNDLGHPFTSYEDLFNDDGGGTDGWTDGGQIAIAMRDCASKANRDPDIQQEAVFRNIMNLITFRQNLFTIVMASQALDPTGTEPVSERRAVATVCRDAYTGSYFLRSFKWMLDMEE